MNSILIVDDEREIRECYSELLGNEGFAVFKAPNAIAANEILKKEKIDIVLLDLKMPGVGGDDLYDVLRSFHKEVRVIVTSVYPLDEQKNIIQDAADYHDKSQGIRILLQKIDRVMNNSC